jgi:uncharacterized protein with HEPN domain
LSRELRLLLEDILHYCTLISDWTRGLTYEQFVDHPVEYHAVIRALTDIGEATKELPDEFRAENADVPWRELAGMRDIIVHRYFGVQDSYIWDAATDELPMIAGRVRIALDSVED